MEIFIIVGAFAFGFFIGYLIGGNDGGSRYYLFLLALFSLLTFSACSESDAQKCQKICKNIVGQMILNIRTNEYSCYCKSDVGWEIAK